MTVHDYLKKRTIMKHENNEEIKMDQISASEKKRLESLKQKKQIFKTKELAVQNALRNLDNKSNKNKIIFDDDIDKVKSSKNKKSNKKRKRDLFDDEDDKNDDEVVWDASKFENNKNVTEKFFGHNITLGNDERFKLDKRFIEDDQKSDTNVPTKNSNETNLKKEKELQLDILENILGAPITIKNKDNSQDAKIAKKGMIRYDPTENDHKEYEINTEKCESEIKKVKKKKKNNKDNTEDPNENAPVEVSKDIYFSVSDSLSKSLKEGGQFSLLKTYGKETNNEKRDDNDNETNMEPLKPPKFQFGFNSKNPFKYDSSDDEHDNKQEYICDEQNTNNITRNINTFFFDVNDVRFSEAEKFFSKEHVPEDLSGELKKERQELKQIMRSKIRKNMKKKQSWGYKKKVKSHIKQSV